MRATSRLPEPYTLVTYALIEGEGENSDLVGIEALAAWSVDYYTDTGYTAEIRDVLIVTVTGESEEYDPAPYYPLVIDYFKANPPEEPEKAGRVSDEQERAMVDEARENHKNWTQDRAEVYAKTDASRWW